MRTKTVKPTRRLGGSSPAIKNIPSSPGGENSEIINILNVKSCYAWDTHTVQCSWHAHLHLKQFDIQKDALTLWIFSVLLPHYKGPACHFILLTLNYVNDDQLRHRTISHCVPATSANLPRQKVLKVVEEMLTISLWSEVSLLAVLASRWSLPSDILSESLSGSRLTLQWAKKTREQKGRNGVMCQRRDFGSSVKTNWSQPTKRATFVRKAFWQKALKASVSFLRCSGP